MHGIVQRRFLFYTLVILASIFLSCWTAFHNDVINPDGICYLQSAATMNQGLSVAAHICDQAPWPFYSMLVFGIAKVSSFSYLNAAYLLNGLFTLITVLTFVAITKLLTTSSRIHWLAALVILIPHQFNSVRADIIRDHGFWACSLVSLYWFLRYFRAKSQLTAKPNLLRYALLWSSAMMMAILFRIEGAAFLLLLPFAAFFDVREKFISRIKTFLQLNTLTLIILVLATGWLMLHANHSIARLLDIQVHRVHSVQMMIDSFNATADALGAHVLNGYSMHDANTILFAMLLGWYLFSVIGNVSLVYAALIVYAWFKRLANFDFAARLTLWSYVLVNVLITAQFLTENLFLAKRYLIALSLVLMLWVPFALENLVQQWRVRKWPLLLAVFFMIICEIGGVINFGFSKKYIRDSGEWLQQHAAENSKIYSNDLQVLYYSNHFGNSIFQKGKEFANLNVVSHGAWQQYDYLALRINDQDAKQNTGLLREISFAPVVVFQNKRADQVRIYRVMRSGGDV